MKYYSQFGEDKFLVEKCKLPEKGIFVDVGAGGIENSNSYYFEQIGWYVLCIEPDKRHKGLELRKLVDNSVVGGEERIVDFVFHHEPSLSGLFHDKKTAVKLKMHRLDTILEKYGIDKIDILSVDVEGNEMDVMRGFSIEKYKPDYVIIEYKNMFKGNKEEETEDYFSDNGYIPIFKTLSNLIFVRKGVDYVKNR